MTAPDDAYAKPKTADQRPAKPSGGSSTRLIVLLAILVVAGLAAGWDYLVARPGRAAAIAKLEPLFPPKVSDNEEASSQAVSDWKPSTQKDVHALLGMEPAATETAGAYLVERYSWRRGIPFLTYDLFVIYDDDALHMLRDATTQESDVQTYRTSTPISQIAPGGPAGGTSAESESPAGDSNETGEAPTTPAPEASGSADSPAPTSEETEPAPAAETPASETP